MANHLKPPAITDHMAISVRAYAKPKVDKSKTAEPTQKRKRKASPLPASPWAIVFDTETLTGPSQSLRFGAYQVRCDGELKEAGIFHEPDGVSEEELVTLQQYALKQGLELITRDEFADRVFYGIGYEYRARIVGFNLPFDISRIAIGHNSARTEMRGGFSFKLTKDNRKPNIQVKHGQKFSFMRFAAPMRQLDNRSDRRRGRKNPVRRGHFLDISTLASAVFAKPFTLKELSEFLKVLNPKLEFKDFEGPINEEMVTYAVRDVQTTWECYVELIKRYKQLGIPNTPPEKIYSEASIGKAYLRTMNIQPWQKCQPDFPDQLLARIMATYLGGRSEVRIRRELREVILCDFLSMYPTVCTLMKLWNFVIANGMTWHETTVETRAWLEKIDLKSFKSQTTWTQLTTLVRVHPDADIFPLRASYGEGDQTTIGDNYVSSDIGLWFTLADCAVSKLLSGKVPEILEAITFTPLDPQGGLKSVRIGGKEAYEVNPFTDDFYKRAIEMRQETKDLRDAAKDAAMKEVLDTEQNALKIAVNATSYGVFVEVNVADMPEEVELSVLSGTDEPFDFKAMKVEEAGPFFHPLLATLITGAARLMLALTETLVEQEALEWAFCDTDSMAIAKPLAMDTAEFHARVYRIVDWFDDLNPYDFKEKILKVEDVNFEFENPGVLRPLYCWAVSAKRYALFNLHGDNKPIIRKASGHGLGHLREPYTAKNPAVGIPKSVVPVHKIGKGFKLCQHDIWWQIVTSALGKHPNKVDLSYHPGLNLPAISRLGITTPHLLRHFKKYNVNRSYRDQAKPFGFMTGLTANPIDDAENFQPEPKKRRKASTPKPIAPFTRDPQEAARTAFDRETGQPVPPGKLKSFKKALAEYHMQHENKFLNGSYRDQGTTTRRHVMVTGVRHIGKEANRLEEQIMLGMEEGANPDYGMSPNEQSAIIAEIGDIKKILGTRNVADMLGISRYLLRQFLEGKVRLEIPLTTLTNLRAKTIICKAEKMAHLEEIRTSVAVMGLRATARLLKRDPSNLKRKLRDNN